MNRAVTVIGWVWAISSLLALVIVFAWGGAFRGGLGLTGTTRALAKVGGAVWLAVKDTVVTVFEAGRANSGVVLIVISIALLLVAVGVVYGAWSNWSGR